MGEKFSKPGEIEINKSSTKKEKKTKFALLGTSQSGKSSVFKQLKRIYKDDPHYGEEGFDFRNSIYSNVFLSTEILSQDCVKKNPKDPFDDPENLNRVKIISEMDQCDIFSSGQDNYTPEIHQMIGELWKENSLVEKFQNHPEDFQITENLQYFLDRFEKLTPPDYIPSIDDILHCQRRTTGLVELNFKIENFDFSFYNFDGLRTSRRIWKNSNIKLFETKLPMV
jgi:energy-coupling factor transporter ATP-binding protein EcfA2